MTAGRDKPAAEETRPPRSRPVSAERYVVARAADIGEGERRLIEAGGREVAVFRLDGELYALLNRCPHQGGPLCHGELVSPISSSRPGEYVVDAKTKLLVCPWHGWEFDLRTGRSFFDPSRVRARPFPVAVEDGKTISEGLGGADDAEAGTPSGRMPGPYRAHTLPVSVEDEYVVVTLPAKRSTTA